MAATGATRGQIAGLLEYCISQQGHFHGALHRWPRDEIILAGVALKLTRLGVLLSTVKAAVDAVRRLHEVGELGIVRLAFDATGRFASADRVDRRVALLGELTEPAEVPAGVQVLIDVGAEARAIDAKLRQHRAEHGVAQRGPRACRKAA
jgi:hypothetical protein